MPSLLCLVAHPDDETILCGGTLALLSARGVAVHVVCLTRGEGGELGEPPLTTREQLGAVREQELVCAVQALGGKSLTFLGYIDPPIGPDGTLSAPEHNPVMLAGQIVNCIQQFRPDVVLTHGSNGEYGHPAHVLMHAMTRAAVAAL
ncbi:MAG: PIG-L family deacetylase, partial [Chloroflexaceae bacterium]|nr:PIG-L family deacetylase [Chloroflexaceae bacterium]